MTAGPVHPEYDREYEDITGYRATHAYEITVRNPDDAGSVIDTAVGAGADRVTGVRFGLSKDTQQDVRTAAIQDAMADAKQDATAVATAGDVTLGPVHSASVSTQSSVFTGVEYASADDAGGATKIDSGPVDVTVRVTVTYQIS